MKVLMLNGSPNGKGCTFTALSEIAKVLETHDIQWEIVHLGKEPVRDCISCHQCHDNRCVFDDIVNEIIEKAEQSDGFIFGTPVYYAHPTGQLLSTLNRVFYSGGSRFAHKPGGAIASARRAGTTASLDVVNKYFTISQMPVVSSTYWNMVHGTCPEDVRQDLEGLQSMRNLGENMAWLLKCIALGKAEGITPHTSKVERTNFIR